MSDIEKILQFWFSEDTTRKWFIKDPTFDREVTQNFLTLYKHYITQEPIASTPKSALALIILFDQFPRNMFRNTPQAFATDTHARTITKQSLIDSYDNALSPQERIFLYMPLMHSEDLEDQILSVTLFESLDHPMSLEYAIQHRAIIERFGRFPHRNPILRRLSTNEEVHFLTQPNSSF